MLHRRFFVNESNISSSTVMITDKENIHHINVLRLKPYDRIVVLDGKGKEHTAKIACMEHDKIICNIISTNTYTRPYVNITIVQSIPKHDKIDIIVEKCTELGVSKIIITRTQRSIKKQVNISRLNRISISASAQAGRIFLPTINMAEFDDIIRRKDSSLRLILWEGAEKSIKKILNEYKQNLMTQKYIDVVLFIGPEGGFSSSEVSRAISYEIIPVTLGKNILRTETASIVGTSIIAYEFGILEKDISWKI
jgi:16S rRNA (uracil1498-N3)-methyltransferase